MAQLALRGRRGCEPNRGEDRDGRSARSKTQACVRTGTELKAEKKIHVEGDDDSITSHGFGDMGERKGKMDGR